MFLTRSFPWDVFWDFDLLDNETSIWTVFIQETSFLKKYLKIGLLKIKICFLELYNIHVIPFALY